jgi:hypothetical protein
MDLSSGGRWAKLVDSEEQNTGTVEIDSSGGIVAVHDDKQPEQTTNFVKEKQEYDYNMMHRTLSQLPPEEQARIGGLPELPESTKIDPETRKAFEKRMKEIWIERQAELEAVKEEFMADMPKLLLARIRRIDSYLQDPYTHLTEDWTEDEEDTVSHIRSVLHDLELHLSDVDAALDFHTLGGWPLLVSLLSDTVHESANQTLTPELLEKVNEIQEHAAWAIGTAVKNMEEFFPYAVEELKIDGSKTTPIDLLLLQIQKEDSRKKLQKIMYALGALLRGNREAQAHFLSLDGPTMLGQVLISQDGSNLAKRILALADDIISDIDLHPQEPTMDALIVKAFAKDEWCQSAIELLEIDDLQETALRTIKTMSPHCQWDKERVRTSVTRVKTKWEEEKEDRDSEHCKERLQLVDSILSEL